MRPESGKRLHDYFHFMDAELGLIYLRVPTWAGSKTRVVVICTATTAAPAIGSAFAPKAGRNDPRSVGAAIAGPTASRRMV